MKRFVCFAVLIMLQLGVAVGWLAYGAGTQAPGEREKWDQNLKLSPEGVAS